MQIGRTSCSNSLANTFRVLLTAAAHVVMQEMRLHFARKAAASLPRFGQTMRDLR
jgi:hypothetical protein